MISFSLRYLLQKFCSLQSHSTSIVPPACAPQVMAAPTPHDDRPLCFLDLPREIRDEIYKLLTDRSAKRTIPDVIYDRFFQCVTELDGCYYPEMMRVNKQVSNEYTTLVMPRMMLRTEWIIRMNQTGIDKDRWRPPFLPARIFCHLKFLDLSISLRGAYSNTGNLSRVKSLVCAITHDMPLLSLISFTARYPSMFTSHYNPSLNLSAFDVWKIDMVDTFGALTNSRSFTVKAKFVVSCLLYDLHRSVRREEQRYSDIPKVTFAVCNGPDQDTFEIGGVNLKFMGVGDDLISDDSNTCIVLTDNKSLAK